MSRTRGMYIFYIRNEMMDIFFYGRTLRAACYKPRTFAFGFNKVVMAV